MVVVSLKGIVLAVLWVRLLPRLLLLLTLLWIRRGRKRMRWAILRLDAGVEHALGLLLMLAPNTIVEALDCSAGLNGIFGSSKSSGRE